MKLFSIIKSERGKPVTKGGNKKLNIELYSGSAREPQLEYEIKYTVNGLRVKKGEKTTEI